MSLTRTLIRATAAISLSLPALLVGAPGAAPVAATVVPRAVTALGAPAELTSSTAASLVTAAATKCPLPKGLGLRWASWPMPNPAGSGRKNPVTYTKLGTRTVRDEVTCLIWQRATPSKNYTFAQAKSYCANLTLGSGGWHLPSRIELTTLIDPTRSGPAIDTDAFPGTVVGFYWTSTAWAVRATPSRAWIVNFYEGLTSNGAYRSGAYKVRCVKSPGGSGSATYSTIAPGQIKDLHTGLVWQRTTASGTFTKGRATTYCSNLTLGGKTNWRLPTIKEIATTVDDRVVAPAIKTKWFLKTDKKAWYWSSSSGLSTKGEVTSATRWGLSYDDGYTNYREVTSGKVRCVR